MAKDEATLYDRLIDWLKNKRATVAVMLLVVLIGGLGTLTESLSKVHRLFWPAEILVETTFDVDHAYTPYRRAPTDDPLFPPDADKSLKYYRPNSAFQQLIPVIRAAAYRFRENNETIKVDSPRDIMKVATTLHPDRFVGQRLFNTLMDGASIFEFVRTSYRDSDRRTDEWDQVFQPEIARAGSLGDRYSRFMRFLARIYVMPFDMEERAKAKKLVSLCSRLWPSLETSIDDDPEYRKKALFFRYVILRRSDPVFLLTVANHSSIPVLLTNVTCDVKAMWPLMDANVSGPLPILDSVVFELAKAPDTIDERLPNGPIKLAPKDAGAVRVRLISNKKAAFLVSLSVLNGDHVLNTTQDFIVVFSAG